MLIFIFAPMKTASVSCRRASSSTKMVVVSTLRAAGMAMKCLPSPLARYSLARVPKFSNNLGMFYVLHLRFDTK